ncbi:MAG: AAA family ATPase, partial [Candidatus Bipolaricaulia bacterium]
MMEERELSLLDLLSQRARRGEPGLRVSRGMRFLRLGVENIFCYRHAELELEEGITVIAGANGSGKSSLLESIFFALYGSRAGPAMDRSLGEILREGAKQGRAWLDFWCEGKQFAIEMGLKRQGDRVVSERESCRLTRDDGAEWQGVEEVAAKVQELLHMDRDDFTHSVYVRQGEIDQLIQAGDEERRGMIDRLLRLERLDRYAARAKEGAQRAVNRRLAMLNGQATGLQREVEALEAEELHRERAHLQREINRRQEELELLEQQRVEREEARAALRERLRRLAEAEREAREGKKEWEEKKRRLAEREGERERLQLLLEGLQTGERERRARLAGILGQLELPRDELLASLKRAEAPGDLPVLPQALVETRERLEEFNQEKQRTREGLARLEAELGHLQLQAEKLDAQVYELRSELAEKRERLTTERTRVEELRSAAEEGDSQVEALKSQIEVCNLERDALATYQKAHAAKLDELRQRSGELRGELAVARTKREQVGEQLARTEEMIRAGRCPACGQPVTAETVAGTPAELEERFHELDKTIHKLREELGNLEGELVAAGEEEEALERLVLLRVEVQAKWDRLEERRQGLTQLEERAKELEERLRQTEDALKENEHELATREGEQRKLGQFIKHKAEE